MRNFDHQLELGHAGEKIVDRFLRSRGYGVIQSYAFLGDGENKAPRLRFLNCQHVLPDLDVVGGIGRLWTEVKTYWHAVLNRTYGIDVHGIRLRLYKDYLLVEDKTKTPVHLLVLEMETGDLLSAPLRGLKTYACLYRHHHTDNCLVYFNRNDFRQAANLSADPDVLALRPKFKEAARNAA